MKSLDSQQKKDLFFIWSISKAESCISDIRSNIIYRMLILSTIQNHNQLNRNNWFFSNGNHWVYTNRFAPRVLVIYGLVFCSNNSPSSSCLPHDAQQDYPLLFFHALHMMPSSQSIILVAVSSTTKLAFLITYRSKKLQNTKPYCLWQASLIVFLV